VQHVGAASGTIVAGSDGATYPFWSPDNAYIAFFANGKLMRAAMAGGVPQPLADAPSARGGTWSTKGVILYSPVAAGPLWSVNADGSGAAEVVPLAERQSTNRWPHFLPDGERFLYFGGNFDDDPQDKTSGIYLGTLGSRDRKLVVLARSNIGYTDSGHIFFVVGNKLVASEFDPATGKAGAEQKLIAAQVGYQPQVYWGAFSVSRTGHVISSSSMGSSLSQLTWYDRSGKQLGTVGERATQSNPVLSPRGDAVALDITDAATRNTDVWVLNLRSGSASRFSFGPDEETTPTWSPDGSEVIFRTSVLDARMLVREVSGAAPSRSVVVPGMTTNDDNLPMSWSRDGGTVLISLVRAGNSEIHAYDVVRKTHRPFIATRALETHPQFSPDNRWVAYVSDETGNREVYVTTYPQASGKWQVSRGGGTEPRWRGDGKELFYIGSDGRLLAVPVSSSGTGFEVGVATPLFPVLARAPISATDTYNYTVTADGQRFLMNRYVPPASLAPFNIILNATAELGK
jgi:Tol biopolymer transport system component